jgi:hypothetical protein
MGQWSYKTAFESARQKCRITCRFYDASHTFVTRLAENPTVSVETIRQLAGRAGDRMLGRYAHIRVQARREAIATLERRQKSEKFLAIGRRRTQNWAQSPDIIKTSGRVVMKTLSLPENKKVYRWSGWPDLNRRPHAPQACTLPGCATPRPISRPSVLPRRERSIAVVRSGRLSHHAANRINCVHATPTTRYAYDARMNVWCRCVLRRKSESRRRRPICCEKGIAISSKRARRSGLWPQMSRMRTRGRGRMPVRERD